MKELLNKFQRYITAYKEPSYGKEVEEATPPIIGQGLRTVCPPVTFVTATRA